MSEDVVDSQVRHKACDRGLRTSSIVEVNVTRSGEAGEPLSERFDGTSLRIILAVSLHAGARTLSQRARMPETQTTPNA